MKCPSLYDETGGCALMLFVMVLVAAFAVASWACDGNYQIQRSQGRTGLFRRGPTQVMGQNTRTVTRTRTHSILRGDKQGSMGWIPCPECRGIIGNLDCPQCHGSGRVWGYKPFDKPDTPQAPAEPAEKTSPKPVGSPAAKTDAPTGLFVDYSPPGSTNNGGIYEDVRSRAPSTPSFPDAATRCHEWTHLLDGRASTQARAGFYVGGGRLGLFARPRCSLFAVNRNVSKYRDDYCKRFVNGPVAASHANDPLDIVEEFTAYCNDMQCQREKHMAWQGTQDQLRYHCAWSDALLTTIKEQDPSYPDLQRLTQFVAYQKDRANKLIGNDCGCAESGRCECGPECRCEHCPIHHQAAPRPDHGAMIEPTKFDSAKWREFDPTHWYISPFRFACILAWPA